MFTALIVEDEKRIYQLISKLVDWNALNIDLIGHCDNARKAMEVIHSRHPDIVITDIRMPGMSGLDLISHVLEEDILCNFIIISGFKDFEYARTAMHYGVDEYLTKPVNVKELTAALTRISNRLKEKGSPQEEKESLFNMRRLLRNAFMDRLTTPRIEIDNSYHALCEKYHLVFRDGFFQGVIIDFGNLQAGRDEHLLQAVVEDMRGIFDAPCFEFVPFIGGSSEIVFLMNYPVEIDMAPLMEKIPETIQKRLNSSGSWMVPFVVGVGLKEDRAQWMRRTLITARSAVCCSIVSRSQAIYFLDKMNFPELKTEEVVTSEYRRNLRTSLENMDTSGFNGAVSRGFEILASGCGPQTVIGFCNFIIDMVIEVFFREDTGRMLTPVDFGSEIKQEEVRVKNYSSVDIFRTIVNPAEVNSLTEVKSRILAWAERWISLSLSERQQLGSRPVREAKACISAHYMEPLSLDFIAAHVHLNPSYFSICFKRETGQNFSNYLASCRIEAAKQMLRDGSKSISAIGEAVGYSDSKYFSKTFTRMVGITPSVYKSLHS